MCDEYDDERMKAFWRILAERDGLVDLRVLEPENAEPIVMPMALEPAEKRKPKSLAR